MIKRTFVDISTMCSGSKQEPERITYDPLDEKKSKRFTSYYRGASPIPKRQRGKCPECGKDVGLYPNGKLVNHSATTGADGHTPKGYSDKTIKQVYQISISNELAARLTSEAERLNIEVEELVNTALDTYLRSVLNSSPSTNLQKLRDAVKQQGVAQSG